MTHFVGSISLLNRCFGGLGLCVFVVVLFVGVFGLLDFFLFFSFLV